MTLSEIATISDVSAYLRETGETELADRVDYLASDEDLDPGDVPATDESALGFLEFYSGIQSDSIVGLACSPEGWIVGEWQWYPDERTLTVWFMDAERVAFVATNKKGEFVARQWNGNTTSHSELKAVLEPEGLFVCRPSD